MSNPDVFDCNAKACGQALYEDELWLCADCGDRFCESHIIDAGGSTESIYVCGACVLARVRRRVVNFLERNNEKVA